MSDSTQDGFVKSEIKNGVGNITFFHPSHNALPSPLLRLLVEEIDKLGADPSVKVIVLESGGNRTFCAGASFDELISIQDHDTGKAFFMGFANVINAIRKCPKLIIGKVQGKAVGGGVGIASAVDYCLATKYASIKLSELAIGIGPFVIEPAVTRKIGLSAMSQLSINPTAWKSADWALNQGLYAQVLESQEELNTHALQFAKELATYNPEAQQQLKKVLWSGTEQWDELLARRAEISGNLVLSDFTKDALARFGK